MSARTSKLLAGFLVAAALVFGLVNMGTALIRSTIPIALDGQVTLVERRHGGVAGSDIWLVGFTDGSVRHVDESVARALLKGDRITKEAWSTSLATPRGPVSVRPGWELYGSFVVMTGVVMLVGVANGHARRMVAAGVREAPAEPSSS